MSVRVGTIMVGVGVLALGLMSGRWLEGRGVTDRLSSLRLFDQGDQPDGHQLFQTRCFVCHGRTGKGDGPSATGLAEKPQDLTDPNWQRATSDDQLHKVIQGGGTAIGRSDAMPPNPDLTEAQIQGVIAYVRSLSSGSH